jgi:hypothetical protein
MKAVRRKIRRSRCAEVRERQVIEVGGMFIDGLLRGYSPSTAPPNTMESHGTSSKTLQNTAVIT